MLQRALSGAAPLAEGEVFRQGVECGLWPLIGQHDAGEVVVDDGGLAAQALLEREVERPTHVVEAVRFAQVETAEAAPVKRECRLGQAELRGERERPLGRHDRLPVVATEPAVPGQVGVGDDELRPGGLRLEQLDCLGDHRIALSVAETEEHER